MRALFAILFWMTLAGVASAQPADEPPETMQDRTTLLAADRAAYQQKVDELRLLLMAQERARHEHDAAVDAYWRQYTGLAGTPTAGPAVPR